MNQLIHVNPTVTAEKIKDSTELALDAINAHEEGCPTCSHLGNRAAKIKCLDGYQLWSKLEKALELDRVNPN